MSSRCAPPRLAVAYRSPDELVGYVNNAKTHSAEQIEKIAGSIREFGFNNPILLDGSNGVIAGHGRLAAARRLGLDEVPTIELAHLSDVQKRAYILADNRLGEIGTGWDLELVALELEALELDSFDIELTGFDDGAVLGRAEEGTFPDLPDGDREPFQQVTFTLHDEQRARVDDALMRARTRPEIDTGLNDNHNGNALTAICEAYLRDVG